MGQSLVVGFRGLHALAQVGNLRAAGRLVLAHLVDATAQIKDEIERPRDIKHRERQQDPFSRTTFRRDVNLALVRHKMPLRWLDWIVEAIVEYSPRSVNCQNGAAT